MSVDEYYIKKKKGLVIKLELMNAYNKTDLGFFFIMLWQEKDLVWNGGMDSWMFVFFPLARHHQ